MYIVYIKYNICLNYKHVSTGEVSCLGFDAFLLTAVASTYSAATTSVYSLYTYSHAYTVNRLINLQYFVKRVKRRRRYKSLSYHQ